MALNEKIREFINDNLIVFDDEPKFNDTDNIFELGYVNSLFAMKMLNYVENEFEIKLENDEIDIKNFSSVANLVELIQKKQNKSE